MKPPQFSIRRLLLAVACFSVAALLWKTQVDYWQQSGYGFVTAFAIMPLTAAAFGAALAVVLNNMLIGCTVAIAITVVGWCSCL